MQPRQKRHVELSSGEANRPLPTQLARTLEPKIRHALMHGTRRRILRTLSRDATPHTTRDLLAFFPGVRLPTITYHVLVLGDCGSLAVSQIEPIRGTIVRSFVSHVTDDARYVAVLRATEQLDDVH
jgi:hypothetical protein